VGRDNPPRTLYQIEVMTGGKLNNPFRPRYAVDVQLLGEDG
jgi:hypothetical protein